MSDNFRNWLRRQLLQQKLSQHELARRSGLSQGVISKVLSGSQGAGLEFCQKLSVGLGIPLDQILQIADVLPPERSTPDVPNDDEVTKDGIELLRAMPDEKRRQAVRYLRFLYQDSDDD